jgi:hypothetical protein
MGGDWNITLSCVCMCVGAKIAAGFASTWTRYLRYDRDHSEWPIVANAPAYTEAVVLETGRVRHAYCDAIQNTISTLSWCYSFTF